LSGLKPLRIDPVAFVAWAVPMGKGFIDYPAFFRALVQANYSGYVAYEMCSPLEGGGSEANLDRCATAFFTYMRELSDQFENQG